MRQCDINFYRTDAFFLFFGMLVFAFCHSVLNEC